MTQSIIDDMHKTMLNTQLSVIRDKISPITDDESDESEVRRNHLACSGPDFEEVGPRRQHLVMPLTRLLSYSGDVNITATTISGLFHSIRQCWLRLFVTAIHSMNAT